MARADLLKRLLAGYQHRDDRAFQSAAEELIREERLKNHPVLANELELIMANGASKAEKGVSPHWQIPLPTDPDRNLALVELRQPDRFLSDLILEMRTRRALDRIIQEYRGWEVLEANGLNPVQRILFCGPPGCGKTATAEAIAHELGLPLLYVRFDAVVSSLLGETSANIRRVFDFAQRGQWVILFDEFDAVARSRDDATEHGEIKRVVNSLLQIMDSFRGRSLILAATNFEQALDWAVWRRFDELISFPLPSQEQLLVFLCDRLKSLNVSRELIEALPSQMEGASYADAERIFVQVKRSTILRGQRNARPEDVFEAIEGLIYRRSVLERADNLMGTAVDRT
jgi:SpoVK/Ycf46/Vps4 family AAA+-type ATPase